MKAISLLVFLASLVLFVGDAAAQAIPPNPLAPKGSGGSKGRNLGGGGDLGAGVSVPKKQTVVVQYIAVTPTQSWTNTSGKTIQARLLAFSGPKPGEPGPIEVIREGKIRLLVTGRKEPVEYPIEQLKPEHRAEAERIAKAAAKGPPGKEGKESAADASASSAKE
jgi:hypothetical protein